MLAASTYGVAGDPPVVLLHGWPLDRSIWAEVASDLVGDGFRVVCPDLPGSGASPGLPEEDWTVEDFASQVADLVQGLGYERAAVAGHSFGGYVALALADTHPDLVAGLGLVGSRTQADSDAARAGRRATIAKVRDQGTRALLPDLPGKLLAPDASPDLRKRAEEVILRCPPEAVIAGLTAMAARPDRGFLLADLPRPWLVVHGAADQLIPVAEAAQPTPAGVPVSREILPGVGHMPMWEAIPATTRTLASWARAAHGR